MTHAQNLASMLSDGGSRLVECPDCGTKNDRFVNAERCYSCGFEWGDA